MEESDLIQIVESLFAKNGFPENLEVNVEVAEDIQIQILQKLGILGGETLEQATWLIFKSINMLRQLMN